MLANATVSKFTYRLLVLSVTSEQQLAKNESEIWVTRLPSMSHPPPSIWRHRVTCLSLKNATAPCGQNVTRWPPITISRDSYIQYLLACQKWQRSNPYNMVKSGLTWRRVFRRRHLGRRVTAVTCLRWPTVLTPEDASVASCFPFDITISLSWFPLLGECQNVSLHG